MTMSKIFRVLKFINLKTIIFNFKAFPFKVAIKFPVLISPNVLLRSIGGKIQIESSSLRTGMIKIGYGDVGIFDRKRSRTIWDVRGTIKFKGKASIGHGSRIAVGPDGILTLGDEFAISAESALVCFKEIVFGANCLLSWDILVIDSDFHKIYNADSLACINENQSIFIGDKCWIGCRSMILKGSCIPNGTVVGAGSLISSGSRNIKKEDCIIGGNPTSIIKENIKWEN